MAHWNKRINHKRSSCSTYLLETTTSEDYFLEPFIFSEKFTTMIFLLHTQATWLWTLFFYVRSLWSQALSVLRPLRTSTVSIWAASFLVQQIRTAQPAGKSAVNLTRRSAIKQLFRESHSNDHLNITKIVLIIFQYFSALALLFSRAVALVFNWKYFGDWSLMRTMCRWPVDDV